MNDMKEAARRFSVGAFVARQWGGNLARLFLIDGIDQSAYTAGGNAGSLAGLRCFAFGRLHIANRHFQSVGAGSTRNIFLLYISLTFRRFHFCLKIRRIHFYLFTCRLYSGVESGGGVFIKGDLPDCVNGGLEHAFCVVINVPDASLDRLIRAHGGGSCNAPSSSSLMKQGSCGGGCFASAINSSRVI